MTIFGDTGFPVTAEVGQLDLDITPMHMRVMKIISRQSQCSSIDIANLLKRDKAQVTRLLKPLIEQELLTKAANPEDKRSQLLVLTEAGSELMEQMTGIENELLAKMTEQVSKEDLDKFAQVAHLMANNLNP